MKLLSRALPFSLLALAASLAGGGALYAQLEGADRGVAPIDSASTLEVTGIEVDTVGKTAEEARLEGWKEAQRLGWKALWSKTNGRPPAQAPNAADSVLNSIVSGIIIQHEQIGPRRYVARLGLLFDRARTVGMLGGGGGGAVRHSAPLLVIPVMATGSAYQSFESRNEWQKAWARFRTGGSSIDYIRPTGGGIDPLLLNHAQTRRPGRGSWRILLDQYGASDVIVPQVHLKRSYPGGPVLGTFSARFGPDNRLIDRFGLRAANSAALPRMLDEGVRRLDQSFARALSAGLLQPDPSLEIQQPAILSQIAAQIEAATDEQESGPARAAPPPPRPPSSSPSGPVPGGAASLFSIQVDTPNPAAVSQAEISVSRVRGVTSALTTSLSLGGTSVMRVTYTGNPADLAAALQAQGWTVSGSGNALRISRGGQ